MENLIVYVLLLVSFDCLKVAISRYKFQSFIVQKLLDLFGHIFIIREKSIVKHFFDFLYWILFFVAFFTSDIVIDCVFVSEDYISSSFFFLVKCLPILIGFLWRRYDLINFLLFVKFTLE